MRRILWAVPCLALVVPFALLSQQSAPKGKPPAEEQETTIKVDVDLVNVLFTVRTKQGGLVGNLGKDDFTLLEDGKQQDIRYFTRENDLPLTIGLLVDVSRRRKT